MSLRSWFFAGLLSALASSSFAQGARAENRVALVIGNSAYQSVPQLPNPANDARRMAELLKSAQFEVTSARDVTQADLRRLIGDFARKVASKGPDTVALVYYGGHGLQVDGDNYLVPIDASIRQEADVPLQTLRLADLMNALAAVPSKTRIVMLDACRNNPFSNLNKTGGRGLAIVDAPNGSIVSYATAPGSVAEDGEGNNSPYTSAFLTVAREPGMPIEQAFKRVRYSVHEQTEGRQTPWESSSLTGDFAFFPGQADTTGVASPGPAPMQTAALETGAQTRSAENWQESLKAKSAREAYELVIEEDSMEAYEAYVEVYPDEVYAQRVRNLLDRRLELVAWHEAVTINTPAAYRSFLTSYPQSDYATTAQRLSSRTDSRSLGAEARARVCSQPIRTRRTDFVGPTRRASLDRDDEPRRAIVDAPAVVSAPPESAMPPVMVMPSFRPPFLHRPHGVFPIKPPGGKPGTGQSGGSGPVVTLPPKQDGTKQDGTKPGTDKRGTGRPVIIKPVVDKVTDKPGRGRIVIDRVKTSRGRDVVKSKPVIEKSRFVERKSFTAKPQLTARPAFQPKVMTAKPTMRPMGGGGSRFGGGGGMRFGGGGGFGRFR